MSKPARPKSAKGRVRPVSGQRTSACRQGNETVQRSAVAVPDSSRHNTISNAFAANVKQSSTAASTPPKDPSSSVTVFPEITRPTSSLTKYRVLPSISGKQFSHGENSWLSSSTSMNGRSSEMDLLTEQAQQMILDSSVSKLQVCPTPPSSASKRKVMKNASNVMNKRLKVYHTKSIFSPSNNLVKESPKPRVPKEPGPKEERLLLALKLPDGSRVERYFQPAAKLINVLAYAHSQYPIIPISQLCLYRMDVVPKKLLSKTNLSLRDVDIKNRTVLYVDEKDDDH